EADDAVGKAHRRARSDRADLLGVRADRAADYDSVAPQHRGIARSVRARTWILVTLPDAGPHLGACPEASSLCSRSPCLPYRQPLDSSRSTTSASTRFPSRRV